MYVKKIYEKGAVVRWAIGHTGTDARQNFAENIITDGLAGGYMSIADGVLTIRAEPEDLRYKILRGPGHYCVFDGAKIEDARAEAGRDADGNIITRARRYVLEKFGDQKSPHPEWPAGYAWLRHYECELEPAQHRKFKAQPGDPLTIDHIKRDLVRKAKAKAAQRRP